MADYIFPNAALDDRLAIVGTSGSGKTYTASMLTEKLLKRGDRVVIVDPLGVWFGLRLSADGKSDSGFSPVIFGGEHADVPINDRAGELVGETVASVKDSAIIDLSGLGTKGAERRFMLAFLTSLYRKHNGTPLHLIIDEADMFAPQKLLDREIDAAKLLGQMETIVRRGRVKGFIPYLITQRPAVLSKDVLSQADGLIAMKLTSSQDRAAIGGWIEGQADQVTGKEILASLPAKQRGSGVVWIPGRGILANADFPKKITFDSSKAPARGEKKITAPLKPIDIEAIKGKLETVTAEAKANDPAALKGEISRLNAQIQRLTSQPATDPSQIVRARAQGIEEGRAIGTVDGVKEVQAAIEEFIRETKDVAERLNISATGLWQKLQKAASDAMGKPSYLHGQSFTFKAAQVNHSDVGSLKAGQSYSRATIETAIAPKPAANIVAAGPGEPMQGPLRKILTVLAQYPQGRGRTQLGIMAGYVASGGSFGTYLSRLRTAGHITNAGDKISITDAGLKALGPLEQLPTGAALREYWFDQLDGPCAKILRTLCDIYPDGLGRSELGTRAGYEPSGGSFGTYLSRLRTRELITGRDEIKASEDLF